MNEFQKGVVGRRVCIKCEFYRNVDSENFSTEGGIRQGRKSFIVRGV